MSNQNGELKNNKGILNIIMGVLIGILGATAYFKVGDFLEERKIDKRILENNITTYNSEIYSDSTVVIDGEPTDLPPYQEDSNLTNNNTTINNTTETWNGKALIGLEAAKKVAIDTIGGGEVIFQEEDIYDLKDAPTYDLKIKNGNKVYEVEVDALTGAVLDYDID